MSASGLLTISAAIEVGAGIAIVTAPSVAASLLFGSLLDTPVALMVGRVAAIALLSLGVACWLARRDEQSCAAIGLIAAMLFYNTAVAALLAIAGLALNLPVQPRGRLLFCTCNGNLVLGLPLGEARGLFTLRAIMSGSRTK